MIKGLRTEHFNIQEWDDDLVELTELESGKDFLVSKEDLNELIESIRQYQKHVLKEIPKYPFMDCTDSWITKNGDVLNLSEMTKKHIHNCKAMIESICRDEGLNANDYIIYKKLINELIKREDY
ncbi:hypothetical protein [uncultured Clostridium sp.]|uniref:hypothetical protein n=1 Tax=uncultured Clostridium sp. TaxID=59620 RepID=UPI0032179168